MTPTQAILIFLFVFTVAAVAGSVAWNVTEQKRRKILDKRLQRSLDQQAEVEAGLLKRNVTSDIPFYGRMLDRFEFTSAMRQRLAQANLNWSVGRLTAIMLVAAALTFNIFIRIPVLPVYLVPGLTVVAGFLPYAYVMNRRTRRLAKFEEQFPEALDFLGRALRAGHAFSMSLEMLSNESLEPLSTEFRQTFDEQNLGLPTETALQNLARRVPLLDVRFFVSAVLLQSRTGGNLSEILDKLAYVIRERFKLKGQVKAYSAHGRLTGMVLTVLPLVIVALMMMVNPEYMTVLVKHPYGKHLIAAAIIMQTAAFLIIRRIVDIKV
ncbi:MAG: type II secretion system F family protein [Acidobacteria bacterium]|nr:type II secretion system F family protein [Acidobacteriota bacterium]